MPKPEKKWIVTRIAGNRAHPYGVVRANTPEAAIRQVVETYQPGPGEAYGGAAGPLVSEYDDDLRENQAIGCGIFARPGPRRRQPCRSQGQPVALLGAL